MIIALLPEKLLRRLQFVMSGPSEIVAVRSWSEVRRTVHERAVAAIVVDPSFATEEGVLEVHQLIASFPSLTVVAYVPLTAVAFRAVTDLSKVGLSQVVLYAHEDSTEALRNVVGSARSNVLTERLLARLSEKLDGLPLTLRQSIVTMFQEPHRHGSAHDLGIAANMPTSKVYRCLESVALTSPKRLLIAAKVLRGFIYLADPGNSVSGVSRKLGYSKPRIFTDQTFDVFGVNPSRVVSMFSDQEAIGRLVEWCDLRSTLLRARSGVR